MFAVGDSAGAQLNSQFAAILGNREYASLFPFPVPQQQFKAIGLNCGIYDIPRLLKDDKERSFLKTYLGSEPELLGEQINPLKYINSHYPAVHLTTGDGDFLKGNSKPMSDLLTEKGIENRCTIYESSGEKPLGHVFHVDVRNRDGQRCNSDQISFFKNYL